MSSSRQSAARPSGGNYRRGPALASALVAAWLVVSLAAATGSARADAPASTDVVFLFDSTGSMAGAISEAQSEISTAMAQTDQDLTDVRYGVAEVRDYAQLYGAPGDRPWTLDQPITSDRSAIQSAIDGIVATGGGDNPEAYARGIWETETNPAVGWRPGARHLIVLVADSIPHDDDLNAGIPAADTVVPSPFDTGIDPGPDGRVGTADDLDWQSVLARLVMDGTPLEAVYYSTDPSFLPYWSNWATRTGGRAELSNSGQLASDLAALAEHGATTSLPPCADGEARDASGQCPLPPCPDGQTRNPSGQCSAPPCPSGKPRNASGQCPSAAVKPVSISGLRKQVHLFTIPRVGGVPFDVDVNGSVDVSGQLSGGSKHAVSSDPVRVVTFSDPAGKQHASFDLLDDRWSAAGGGSSRPGSVAVTLAWPAQGTVGKLSLPLFGLSGGNDYASGFAKLRLDATVDASISTSVGDVAAWLRRSAWLPRPVQLDSLAWVLSSDGSGITRAYGSALTPSALAARLSAFLDQALPLAKQLHLFLPHVQSTGLSDAALRAGRSWLRRLPAWFSSSGIAPTAGPAPGNLLPIGLRSALRVTPLSDRALRRGAWRRLSGAGATAAATATLAEPLSYRAESLWTSSRSVRRGGSVAVLAGRLSRSGHAGVELVRGPYAAEAPLRIRRGIAGGVVRIPRGLPSGPASIAVVDFSRLRHGSGRGVVALAHILVR